MQKYGIPILTVNLVSERWIGMSDIVAILPFPELVDQVMVQAKKMNVDLQAVVGDLEEGVEAALKLSDEDVHVIISRGGTAELIAQVVELPVVFIMVTMFDVYRTILDSHHFKALSIGQNQRRGAIGLAGFFNVIFGADTLQNLLPVSVTPIYINSRLTAEADIKKAWDSGAYSFFVGDAVSFSTCCRMRIPCELIQSGEEAIDKALYEAIRVVSVRKKERERTSRYLSIINAVTDGVLATDTDDRLLVCNPRAETLLQIKAKYYLGKPVQEMEAFWKLLSDDALGVSGNDHGLDQVTFVRKLHGRNLVYNRKPVQLDNVSIGTIWTFQDVTEIQKYEQTLRRQLDHRGLTADKTFADIVATAPAMQKTLQTARQYALAEATVLLLGESGTGKEIFAQAIHNGSACSPKPFVPINCSSMPAQLLESELFGYEEGAFTGALRGGKPGIFELAHNGTLFLDEIGDLPLEMQTRLLRVLQEKKVMRLGGTAVIPVNVRIIAATNQDLVSAVDNGKFRLDLFYRLYILPLRIPPLRDRKEDILALISLFVKNLDKLGDGSSVYLNEKTLDGETLRLLQAYHWPGNVRELHNLVERFLTLQIPFSYPSVHAYMEERRPKNWEGVTSNGSTLAFALPKDQFPSLMKIEQEWIAKALAETQGNVSMAAALLGINRATLYRKLKEQTPS